MSSTTKNYVYLFGKKKPNVKEKILTKEEIAKAKALFEALNAEKEKQ